MRGNSRSSVCSLTTSACGSIGAPAGCARAGAAKATRQPTMAAANTKRARASGYLMAHPLVVLVRRGTRLASRSHGDVLAISGHPAPGAGAVATLDHAFLVDLGDDIAVARKQRLGR